MSEPSLRVSSCTTFFEASSYNKNSLNHATIPKALQREVVKHISMWMKLHQNHKDIVLLDVCCGGGWLGTRISSSIDRIRKVIFLDDSENQLGIATASHITCNKYESTAEYIKADVLNIPLKEASVEVIVNAFSIHLFDLQDKRIVFSELSKTLSNNGLLFVLSFRPENIGSLIFNKYVDGFYNIDRTRYIDNNSIPLLAQESYLKTIDIIDMEVLEKYSVDEMERFIRSEPFSTFYLLKKKYGTEKYKQVIDNAVLSIRRDFQGKLVPNKIKVTLFVFKKCVSTP